MGKKATGSSLDRLKRENEVLRRMILLTNTATSFTDRESFFRFVVNNLKRNFPIQYANFFGYDHERMRWEPSLTDEVTREYDPLRIAICEKSVQEQTQYIDEALLKQVIEAGGTSTEEYWPSLVVTRSVFDDEKRVRGTFLVEMGEEGLGSHERELIDLCLNYLSIMIDDFYLQLRMKDGISKLLNLREVSLAINRELDLVKLFHLIANKTSKMLRADRSTVYLIERKANELFSIVSEGIEEKEIRLKMGVGIAGHVAQTGQLLNIDDVYADPRFSATVDQATGYRTKTILCVPLVDASAIVVGIIQVINKMNGDVFTEGDLELLQGVAAQCAVALENAHLHYKVKKQFESFVQVMANTLELKNTNAANHSQKVAYYSKGIAQEMGLSESEVESIRLAGLLHDYGKIALPDYLLKKKGGFTDEEITLFRKHVDYSKKILSGITFLDELQDITEIVAAHHERLDGSGYPKGLMGKDIPAGAKIISVADSFDAITSDRNYRSAMSYDLALELMETEVDTLFDREVVKALRKFLQRTNFKVPDFSKTELDLERRSLVEETY